MNTSDLYIGFAIDYEFQGKTGTNLRNVQFNRPENETKYAGSCANGRIMEETRKAAGRKTSTVDIHVQYALFVNRSLHVQGRTDSRISFVNKLTRSHTLLPRENTPITVRRARYLSQL